MDSAVNEYIYLRDDGCGRENGHLRMEECRAREIPPLKLPDEMVDCGGPEYRYLRELELKNGRSVDWSIELSNVQAVELRPNRPKERNSPKPTRSGLATSDH